MSYPTWAGRSLCTLDISIPHLDDSCQSAGWILSWWVNCLSDACQDTCVSAKRERLDCLDSAKVSPAPQAYQKTSVVELPLPTSTKEIQKTLPSLLLTLAADECLWCRGGCLFEVIKYGGMEKRKMVQYLRRLTVLLLTVLYSIVGTPRTIFKSSSIQQTESHLQYSLSLSLLLPYVLFRRGIFPAYPTQVNPIFSLTLKLLAHIAAPDYLIQAWFYSWPLTFSRCKAESPFLWRLRYNSASMKTEPSIGPSLPPSLFINSLLEGISPTACFLLLVLTTDGNNCLCLHWVDMLINSSTKHRKGKFFRKWGQIHITHLSHTSIPEWHFDIWMGSVSMYAGTCPSILQTLVPWYGTKHLIKLMGISREAAIGMEGRWARAYVIKMMAIVVVQVGKLGSQTSYLPLKRNQSGDSLYSIWRTEFKGDMAQSGLSRPSLKIRLKLGLFVSMRRASARLFANLPATMI